MRTTRRDWLKLSVLAGACLGEARAFRPELDRALREEMERRHIPGLAAAILRRDRVVWSGAYGEADLHNRTPMTTAHLQNIGSISKTFTTAALMQLWEKGLFQLDQPVDAHLPFPVRHPQYRDRPITFRQLMTHRSSIRDGVEYARHYACGDPRLPLGTWLRHYLVADGPLFSPQENFHPWAPGERFDYCNVSYGLLAYLTEVLSGVDFAVYCARHLFEPLGMASTAWYLREIDTSRHAIPYTYWAGGQARGPAWGGVPLGAIGAPREETLQQGYQANCLYNHPNYPDGFLRTSVEQICRYMLALLNGGSYQGRTLLEPATLQEMFRQQTLEGERVQGLTWQAQQRQGELHWGHGGSDPGINSDLRLRFGDKTGAVVFMNTNGVEPAQITHLLMEQAGTF